MGARAALGQRKALGAGLAVVLLLIAGGVTWINMGSARTPTLGTKVWYFDPAAKSLVVMPSGDAPTDRPELVRARVFSAGSCRDESQRHFYLQKVTRRERVSGVEDRAASAVNRPEDAAEISRVSPHLVAAQDSPERWVDLSEPEGRSVVEFSGKVPEGTKLTECYPESR